ncbi:MULTISPECIES: NlpC/P60 family protein [Pseudomonas]|uniref:NlpC/P60 family protein n=1 Tax=Pseudomonas TaxID=286 RepID=UPI0030017283
MNAVIAAARECLDTPFKHQGRVLSKGMDCAGVLVHVLKSQGLPVADTTDYPNRPFDGMLEKILAAQPGMFEISKADMAPGDVLLMRVLHDPQHIAILSYPRYGRPYIVHGCSDNKKCVEQPIDAVLTARIVRVYRLQEKGQ